MKKLGIAADRIDKVLNIVQIVLMIGIVTSLVFTGIAAAGYLFDLPAEMIGTGFSSVDVGFLELQMTPEASPALKTILLHAIAEMLLLCVYLVFCRDCVRRVRLMLQPMKRGEPFDGSISTNIRGIANLSIALGVISNVIELGGRALLVSNYDLTSLLLSDAITAVTVSYEVDFTFVGIFLILRLLASVFQYGTELQQLSDETL